MLRARAVARDRRRSGAAPLASGRDQARRAARQLLPLIALAAVLGSCRPDSGTASGADVRYPVRINGHTLSVEIADTPARQRTGLMFRDQLPPDQGMLFIYDQPQPISLWMKNTRIPLSAAFLDAGGRIINIAPKMTPFDEQTTHRAAAPAAYALEVNEGWFAAHGINPGDAVDLGAVPRAGR